ncbi:unnamed protein product [Musa acuminata subsp. burmannicoides]
MALAKAKEIVSSAPVVVFSKTNCGHSKWVKELLTQLGVFFKVIELDLESDGSDVQSALTEWTTQRKLPIVFIGGNHIGGDESTRNFFTRMLQALEDASIVSVGQNLDIIKKFELSLPPAADNGQLRTQMPSEINHSMSSKPLIDSEDREVSDDDDDRNHKHRRREAHPNMSDNDVQELSMRQTNRKRNKPFESRKMFHDNINNINMERDASSKFEKRRPIFTPGMRVSSDLSSRARTNQTYTGPCFDKSTSTGRPPVGRGRGRSTISRSLQDSRFNPFDTHDFASQVVSQGLPTHPSLFVGTGIPAAASSQNACWGTYGFVPGMNSRILDPLQPLGLQGALQSTITPLFNMGMPRLRCRDFDEQGFCLRGDMCPMEHGVNRIVVEDVQSLSQFNLPVSDPNSHALGIQAGPGSLPSVRAPSGLVTGGNLIPAKDAKTILSDDPLKLTGVSSACGAAEADVYDPDQPLWNNECPETSGTGFPLLSNDEPLWNADSSSQQSHTLSNGFKSDQASRVFMENIGSQSTNSSIWGRIGRGSRSEMGIKTSSNAASISHLSDATKEDNEKSMVNTSVIPEKRIPAEDMGYKTTELQPLSRLHVDSGRNSGRMSQKASRTLYVHGIPQKNNTREALLSHFQKFGEVVDIYIPLNSEKAFVQFSKREEAEAALEAPDAVMGNRFIKLWWANRDRVYDVRKNNVCTKLPPSSSKGGSSFPSCPSGHDKEKEDLNSPVPTGRKTPASELLVAVPGLKISSPHSLKIASPVPKKLEGLELLKEELRKKQEILAQKRDEFRRQLDKFEKQAITVKKGEVASGQTSKKLKVDIGNEAAKAGTPRAPITPAGGRQEVENTGQTRESKEVLVSPTTIANAANFQNSNTEETSHLTNPDNQSTSFRVLPPLPADFTDVAALQDHFSVFGDLASVVLEEPEERSENDAVKTPENCCARVTFISCDNAKRAYVGGKCWQGHNLHLMWLSDSGNSNRACGSQEIMGFLGGSSAYIRDDPMTSVISSPVEESSADVAISGVTAVMDVSSSRGLEDVHCDDNGVLMVPLRTSHPNPNTLSCEDHPGLDVPVVKDKMGVDLAQ